MNEDDSDEAKLSEEPRGLDLSFILLFGVVVMISAGFWILNNPQWAWFGLLSKLMSIVCGIGFVLIGCLLILNPHAVRWIASLGGNARRLGSVYLCMSAGFLGLGFVRSLI
jgi:hypothetical protein